MANEANKDFNAMLHDSKDMPKIQAVSDPRTIAKYGGSRMFFAPPIDYDRLMRQVPPKRRGFHRAHHRRHLCVHRGLGQLSAGGR